MKQEVHFVEKLFENKKKELMRSPEAWIGYLETVGKTIDSRPRYTWRNIRKKY